LLFIYRMIFIIAVIVGSPYLIIKAIWGNHGIKERLGFIRPRASGGRLFWFHAASVGELKVLSAVIPEIRRILPDIEIAISTTTASGKKRALDLFGPNTIVFLQPLEINSAILRAIENLRPEKLVLIETEIWPLLIWTAADCNVKPYLINARMSERSFKTYRWFRSIVGMVLGRLRLVLAQTEADAKRFAALGAPAPQVVGNTKFDQVFLETASPKQALSSGGNSLIFVAGSIRRGEDRIFAEIIARSQKSDWPVFFVLVPRHMKDVDELKAKLRTRGVDFALWSDATKSGFDSEEVLVVDTMGELTSFYRSADLAFVGGSLVPIGGHDPAEPAALGKPVIFGPHMENAGMAADLLLRSGGAEVVRDADAIIKALEIGLKNRPGLVDKGRRCRDAILAVAGVSRKIARILAEDL